MRRAIAAALCCGIIAALATGAGAEVGDMPDQGTWVTDGPVYAIARAGDRTFVGGRFSYVGRRTGTGVQLAPAGAAGAGDPTPTYGAFPEVAGGRVLAAVSDRAGGWFIGGDFATVGGESVPRLAHIVSDGAGGLTVDADFDPAPVGTVHALALGATSTDSGVLYVGGKFSSIAGDVKYVNFGAVSATDGAPVGLWPSPNDTVTDIDVLRSGQSGAEYPMVFLAGDFKAFGGTAKLKLAAIWGVGAGAALEGTLTGFGQGTDLAGVRTVRVGDAVANGTTVGAPVYLGGDFGLSSFKFTITAPSTVAGQAFGTVPAFTCASPCVRSVRALELSPDGQTLYVGGRFEQVGAGNFRNLAAISAFPNVHVTPAPTATARTWAPDPNGAVGAIAHSDSSATPALYVGGDFSEVLGASYLGLAGLSPTDTAPAGWDPQVAGGIPGANAGTVNAIAVSAQGVYAGGSFTAADARRHDNVAAFDAAGALVDGWSASADGTVFALAVGNDRLYLGGLFTHVGGEPRTRLAAVGVPTGTLDTAFAPAAEPSCTGVGCNAPAPGVLSLALTDQTLYVGGSFAKLAGQERANAGAVNAIDGTSLAWAPNPDETVYSLLATCGTVYAGGAFANAGGQARSRIGSFDPTSGAATAWNPSAGGGAVYALARDGEVIYAGGSFATIGGTERQRIAALDAATGSATAWNPSIQGTGDFVRALAVPPGGSVVYAGGQIGRGGSSRSYAAAFDRTAGATTAWNPGAEAPVRALVPVGDALLVGGEFRQLGRQMQQGFGSFGLATATADQPLTCAVPAPEPVPEEPAPEPPPAPRPTEPYRDTLAPVLGRVSLTNKRFRTAEPRQREFRASARKRAPVGTRIRYRLSEPSVLRLAFSRRVRVVCKSRRAKKPCYRWRRAGTVSHLSRAGAVAPRFVGKVRKGWLRPGRYRVRVRAVDLAGNRSAAQRRAFTIVQR